MEHYNEVFVKNSDFSEYEEINPEYVYLTIPAEWVCVYHKLLIYVSELGIDFINDCNAHYKGNAKNIINCWNMFQSAVASKNLGLTKQADTFIKYINKQLDSLYGQGNINKYCGTNIFPVTKDGHVKALVSCDGDLPKFYIDTKDGHLYQKEESKKVFTIDDNNLNVKSDNKI